MKVYVTHAGLFHCDEITGYVITKLAGECDSVKRLNIIDGFQPNPNDYIIADILREYSPQKNIYDHHQEFLTRPNGYPYASAGLLWKHFGEQVIKLMYPDISGNLVGQIADRVDVKFIQGIDAHDSDNMYGVLAQCTGGDVEVKTLPLVVNAYNSNNVHDDKIQLERFIAASEVIEQVLCKEIELAYNYFNNINKYNSIKSYKDNENEVVYLPEIIAWKDFIHEVDPNVKFVISPSAHPGSKYVLIAVPIQPNSRIVKVPIERPKWFDGFIHVGKWIAGSDSLDEFVNLACYNL